MFCKNRITLIGFLGKDAETRFTPNGTAHTRFSLATNVSWKDKDSGEYKTRAEWHRIVVWGKFGEWAGSLKKGAFIEAEGELWYREFQPNGSDAKIRTAEIHAISILTLDRAEKTEHEGETAAAELTGDDDTPF
jgi:single-strand DNA-binding protein